MSKKRIKHALHEPSYAAADLNHRRTKEGLVLVHGEFLGRLGALRDCFVVELSELLQRLLHGCYLLAAD